MVRIEIQKRDALNFVDIGTCDGFGTIVSPTDFFAVGLARPAELAERAGPEHLGKGGPAGHLVKS